MATIEAPLSSTVDPYIPALNIYYVYCLHIYKREPLNLRNIIPIYYNYKYLSVTLFTLRLYPIYVKRR